MFALSETMDAFYPPADIVNGKAPVERRIRAGGMVKDGSVVREPDSVAVSFILSDLAGSEYEVRYVGILPDLFREGQGIMATGRMTAGGYFAADEVLAKHDENYMPRELEGMTANNATQSQGGGSE